MVLTSLPKSRSSFQCRFCLLEVNSYVGVVCHELDVHSPELSCVDCEALLGRVSDHYLDEHAESVVTSSSCKCCGERFALEVRRKNFEEQAEPGLPDECDPEEITFKDEPLDLEEPNSYDFGEDVRTRTPTAAHSPRLASPLLKEEATSSPPPGLSDSPVAGRVKRRAPKRKRYQYIPMKKIDLVAGEINEVSDELDKENAGLFGQHGWIHDTDVGVFCGNFVDIVERKSSPDEIATDLAHAFVTDAHGNTHFGEPKRDRRKSSLPKEQLLCSHCALPFGTRPALIKHAFHVHGDDSGKVFGCKTCDKNYKRRNFLIRHCAWMRLEKKFKCKIRKCDLHFASTSERITHVLDVHGGIACQYCDEKFVQWNKWRNHIDEVHDENREVLTCRICKSATFTVKKELKDHERRCRGDVNERVRTSMARVGGKVIGRKGPPVSSELAKAKQRDYIRRWNRMKQQRLHKCSICCMRCYTPERQAAHEEACHYRDSEGNMQHKCDECSVVFLQVRDLNDHMKTHPGFCDFKCPHCPKQYMCQPALYWHVKKDHLKTRWVCETCGHESKSKHQFLDHMAKHEGKPKYMCAECGQQFYFFPTFYDHRKKYCPMLQIS